MCVCRYLGGSEVLDPLGASYRQLQADPHGCWELSSGRRRGEGREGGERPNWRLFLVLEPCRDCVPVRGNHEALFKEEFWCKPSHK